VYVRYLLLRRGAAEGALVPHFDDALYPRERAQLRNAIGWGKDEYGVQHILDRAGNCKSPVFEIMPQHGLSGSDSLALLLNIGGGRIFVGSRELSDGRLGQDDRVTLVGRLSSGHEHEAEREDTADSFHTMAT